ncbi:MAG: hypothetical protein AMJ46_01750 [Latescibacteria bacterium DG_63]|nr:MAG: hypothetical protein AMJ46_01750 [Latescibacteria bacterium DG_63]
MHKTLMISLAMMFVLAFVAGPAAAYWDESMPHKMHFPQLPDITQLGWDVNSTFNVEFCCSCVVADDWTCSESGFVKEIHWWGSWMDDSEGLINYFRIEIYSNDTGPPSKPDRLLWSYDAPYTTLHVEELQTPTRSEGWLCPCCGAAVKPDHMMYYQYNLNLPEGNWFEQVQGETYWLSIQAVMETAQAACWGWKTADVSQYPPPHTGSHYMDDAAYSCAGGPWFELKDPFDQRSLDLAFVITGAVMGDLSCWTWETLQGSPGGTGSRPLVCPDGDGRATIWVCLQDAMGMPIVGVTVQANFVDASSCLFTCKPVSGVTDAAGHARLIICGGLEVPNPPCCFVVTSVTAVGLGVVPYWTSCCPPGGAGPFPDDGGMQWLSPDMTQSGPSALNVEGLDFAIFGADWLSAACRSDYDCDGTVGGLDFALFAGHWLHNCSSCP